MIHMVRTGQLATMILLIVAPMAAGATYYVDIASGNDNTGNGSMSAPWQTMAKAEDEATGGDTVYLREGTYPKFRVDAQQTPMRTDYLTWKAYPGEDVTISGLNLSKYWSQPTHGYDVYMSFEDLEIYDAGDSALVVEINGSQYIRLINCEIHGEFSSSHVRNGKAVYAREARYIIIDNCELHTTGVGIMSWAWDVQITRCKIHNLGQDGVQFINAVNCLLQDSEIHDVTDGPDGSHNDGVQMWCTDAGPTLTRVPFENITIRRCHFWNIQDQGFMIGGNKEAPSFDYPEGVLIENSLIEASLSTMSAELNCEYTKNVVVRNCTFPAGWVYFTRYSTCEVYNVVCNMLSTAQEASSTYNDYNVISHSTSGVTPGVHSAVGVDPCFVDAVNGDYRLNPDSPAIDAGVTTGAPNTDRDGLGRIDTVGTVNLGDGDATFWDIGCHEYQGAAGGGKCAVIGQTNSNLGTGVGEVVITAPGYYEVVMREGEGGKISEFYDLTADPSKTQNLSVEGSGSIGMLDGQYLSSADYLHKDNPTTRTLEVIFADERRVVVKCSGELATDVDMQVYYTFHAPIYEGTFVDAEVYVTNNTPATISSSDSWNYIQVASDPGSYTFDWQGDGSTGSQPDGRWVELTTGNSCDAPNVAPGRSFRLIERTMPSGAVSDTNPTTVCLRGPARDIEVGQTLREHLALKCNIAAEPSLFTAHTDLGTGSGLLTITCPNLFEIVMDESAGGGIRGFYDLRVDHLRQTNFASSSQWATPLFDVRYAYSQWLHKSRTSNNRITLTTVQPDEVVASVTGTIAASAGVLDFTCDYTFRPSTISGTDFGITLTVDNNSDSTVPATYDFVYLQGASDPTGATFDWQGASGGGDGYWLKLTVGDNATVSPVTTGLFMQLEEMSYGGVFSTDSIPPGLNHRFATPAQADGGTVVREFELTTSIAGGPPPIPGDANSDGAVDLDDFVILKVNFGRTDALWEHGDFDGDRDVDLDDFVTLKRMFGR